VRRLTAAALAEEVGIADGTIFRHFRNMREIVSAAIERFGTLIEETFPPEDGDPFKRLGALMVNRLALVRRHPELLRLAFNDRLAEAAGAEGSERVERLVERSLTFIGRCLEEARVRGELGLDAPLTLLVWMVIGVLRGAANERTFRASEEPALSGQSPEDVWKALEGALRGQDRRYQR
jgi:AcrR family transcriptional regulator